MFSFKIIIHKGSGSGIRPRDGVFGLEQTKQPPFNPHVSPPVPITHFVRGICSKSVSLPSPSPPSSPPRPGPGNHPGTRNEPVSSEHLNRRGGTKRDKSRDKTFVQTDERHVHGQMVQTVTEELTEPARLHEHVSPSDLMRSPIVRIIQNIQPEQGGKNRIIQPAGHVIHEGLTPISLNPTWGSLMSNLTYHYRG